MNEDEVDAGREDEGSRDSLGVYESLERSDIRPDFLRESGTETAQERLKQSEQRATGEAENETAKASKAKGTSVAIESTATSGLFERGEPKKKGLLRGKGRMKMLVAAAPLILIFGGVILLCTGLLFAVQSLFVGGVKAELDNHWNSTETASTATTDNLTDSTQLAGGGSLGDTIFDNMGFTEEEKQSFREQGLEIKEYGDAAAAFTYTDPNGNEHVIVSSSAIGKMMNGEMLASGDEVAYDSGAEGMSEEEAKQAIIDQLGIAAETENVKSFPDALKNDRNFRRMYKTGAEYWRGGISGWYSNMMETVRNRLGVSRNNFKDWQNDTDELKNEQKLIEFASTKPAATAEINTKGQSLMEQVKAVASQSSNPDCGTSSAFNSVESVVAADQTARQVSAASLFLESIDKTRAGEWEGAPLNSMMNIFFNAGGAETESIHSLFSHTTVNQANELVQKASAQAHGNNETILSQTNGDQYRSCMYVGNTEQGSPGAVVEVGSIFKPLQWLIEGVKSLLQRILSLFGVDVGGGSYDTYAAEAALTDTVSQYEQMQDQKYITGEDTALLGEGIISGAERIYNEKAKSDGQVIGDNSALTATYRAQQEIIAEQAEYDRETKSPFDASSQYTFLGSIVHSLVPFATSNASLNLKSTLAGIGSAVSGALTDLLPTSLAAGELDISRGDCVFSNNIGGVSNPHCNNYYNSDLNMLSSARPADIYQTVRNYRYDEAGYVYGVESSAPNKGSRADSNAADWGDAALNPQEDSLPAHWQNKVNAILSMDLAGYEGTPNGCESDWYYELRAVTRGENIVWLRYYYFDRPNEWAYSRATNFLYDGYLSGWHNRLSDGTIGVEDAKNESAPEACELDMTIENGQPAINRHGALGMFILASGQRTAEWGVTDEFALDLILESDFTKGRLHPCFVASDECSQGIYRQLGWWDGKEGVASNSAPEGQSSDGLLGNKTGEQFADAPIISSASGRWTADGLLSAATLAPGLGDQIAFIARSESDGELVAQLTPSQIIEFQSRCKSIGGRYEQFTSTAWKCVSGSAEKQDAIIRLCRAYGSMGSTDASGGAECIIFDDNTYTGGDGGDGSGGGSGGGSSSGGSSSSSGSGSSSSGSGDSGGASTPVNGRTPGQISDDFRRNTANSAAMSRWIGGSAYVYYDGSGMSSFGSMKTGFSSDERFRDPTLGDSPYFWQENKYYQEYVQLLGWLENIGRIEKSSATVAVEDYYDKNPLDQSYEGIIARYAGMSRDEVVAVVDLLQYIAYLNEYQERVAELGPLLPVQEEKLDYSSDVVVIAERIIQGNAVVYDELRNRTVTV